MQYKKYPVSLFIFIISSCWSFAMAQPYPQNYFRCPLDIPISLAGNFGELRANHFHTGLDIKTAGKEGLLVHAAADGYVSRIAVSATGYGNALYITHPNGYTTVYGHLSAYNAAIQSFLRQTQYKTESFEQDVKLDKDQFPVSKGDVVAYSGNTGSSGGPHLHFEIRETKTEKPVNPLLFGFNVPDIIPPVIQAIKIYPLDTNSYVKVVYDQNGKSSLKSLTANYGQNVKVFAYKKGEYYYLKNVTMLQAEGNIGFSVEANDYKDHDYNKIGVYSIELCVNEEEIYHKSMNILDFDLKRYINTHVDYAERMKTGNWFEKCYVSPNNELPIYDSLKNRGIVPMKSGNIYHICFYLNDYNNNYSTLAFDVSSPQVKPQVPPVEKGYDSILSYDKPHNINLGNIYINVSKNIFYDNVEFTYQDIPGKKNGYSDIYNLGNAAIPCQDYFDVGIRADKLPVRLQSKACIVSYAYGYLGGTYDNGWIKAKTRTLGKFLINVDTIPPTLVPVNIKNGKNMAGISQIRILVKDNMSGVKSYRGTVDGHWVLFQHDAKRSLIYYTFDEHCPSGNHKLVLTAADDRANTRTLEMEFKN